MTRHEAVENFLKCTGVRKPDGVTMCGCYGRETVLVWGELQDEWALCEGRPPADWPHQRERVLFREEVFSRPDSAETKEYDVREFLLYSIWLPGPQCELSFPMHFTYRDEVCLQHVKALVERQSSSLDEPLCWRSMMWDE